ncbi:hypothetical protein KP509_20G048300 [Ceratopteris richardii]|nr:hypothetical protein KP509_20G048300 [Ceratopteris richardii]
MLDPLQIGNVKNEKQNCEVQMNEARNCETEIVREHLCEPLEYQPVDLWSVDNVVFWLQQNVHFNPDRMTEIAKEFCMQGIDGSGLLSLQRSSDVCSSMTDTEWLLLCVARSSLVFETTDEFHKEKQSVHSVTPKNSIEEHSEGDFMNTATRMQRSLVPESTQDSGSFLSYLRLFNLPRILWSSISSDSEQEPMKDEIYLLQEEVLSAQEREASLQARMDHLDQVLRTSKLAGYFYSRIRWTPLPGEIPVEGDVDDWLQRFLVLEGSTIFYYVQAADLSPHGAIVLKDIVDVGPISGQLPHDEGNVVWYGFHITTNEGVRFECATTLKLQAELWMSALHDVCPDQHVGKIDDDQS